RNLRYGSDPGRPLREAIQAWPATSDISIRSHYDALWRAYSSVSGAWNPRVFSQVIAPIVESLAEQPSALSAFFERLATVVMERTQLSEDLFRPPQVCASMVVCLLPYMNVQAVAGHARRLQVLTGETLMHACASLLDDLKSDRFALLAGADGGLSDLF